MDDDFAVDDFEVEAVFAGAEAVEGFVVAGEFAEAVVLFFGVVDVGEVVWGDFEFVEDLELFEGGEVGDFGGGDFVEDDLEHVFFSHREGQRHEVFSVFGLGGLRRGWIFLGLG